MYVPSVTSRTHREMYPDGRTSLLQDQLVEILLLPVRNVQQDAGIAYRLFLPGTVDVHRATREMVRVGCTSTELIGLWPPETTLDHDRALL